MYTFNKFKDFITLNSNGRETNYKRTLLCKGTLEEIHKSRTKQIEKHGIGVI